MINVHNINTLIIGSIYLYIIIIHLALDALSTQSSRLIETRG